MTTSGQTNMLTIRTPEGIVFSMQLASPVARCLAWAVDALCVMVTAIVVQIIVGIFSLVSSDVAGAMMFIMMFVLQIFYPILSEWFWRGQTVGKRVLRLRVMDAQGLRLHFSQVVIRNLLRAVDFLPALYLTGGITTLFNRRAQRLGDLAANTIVVRQPRLAEPNLDSLMAGKFNSLRLHSHLAARLRQRVTPVEASAALQALVRRDELEPVERVKLFAAMAAHFKALVEFPPEDIEALPDEQYVRNVVDILFRPRLSVDRGPSKAQTQLTDAEAPEEASMAPR